MTRMTYDELEEKLDKILIEAYELDCELIKLVNPDSYLDGKIYAEFRDEIDTASYEARSALMASAGWTSKEFWAENDRRVGGL